MHKVIAYKNYGVLGNEFTPMWNAEPMSTAKCYDEYILYIPDEVELFYNRAEQPILNPEDALEPSGYFIWEAIRDVPEFDDDYTALVYIDNNYHEKKIAIEVRRNW